MSESAGESVSVGFGYDELKDFDDGIVPFIIIGH